MSKRSRRAQARLSLAEQKLRVLEGEVARLRSAGSKPPEPARGGLPRHLPSVIGLVTLIISFWSAMTASEAASSARLGVSLTEEQIFIARSVQTDGRAERIAELTRLLHDRESCEGDPVRCPHRASLRVREAAALDLVTIDPARLAWADLKNGKLEKHFERPTVKPVDLSHARLDFADMLGAHLVSANLYAARAASVNLTDADLSNANLEHVFLRGAFLGDAQLQGTRMTSAWLNSAIAERANFSGADMFAARLQDLRATGARFDNAILLSVRLDGADLRAAHFLNASLRNSSLLDADLRGADLTNADLSGADLRGADLRDARGLASVKCDEDTLWPEELAVPLCVSSL